MKMTVAILEVFIKDMVGYFEQNKPYTKLTGKQVAKLIVERKSEYDSGDIIRKWKAYCEICGKTDCSDCKYPDIRDIIKDVKE